MRLVLKSTDSLSVYGDNRACDFRVRLPRHLPLSGDWTIELTEYRNSDVLATSLEEIFVYCSVCDDSIVGERQKPLTETHCPGKRQKFRFFAPLSGTVTHQ